MSLQDQLLDMLPGMTPPPGVTSDFVHPYSLQKYNVITLSVCMTVSTLFVAMRLYTNARITRTLNWEDCTILLPSSCTKLIVYRHMLHCMGKCTP